MKCLECGSCVALTVHASCRTVQGWNGYLILLGPQVFMDQCDPNLAGNVRGFMETWCNTNAA